ncbi:MAG: hypothetical protein P9X24_15705 [Candidatus Hatepunaea meridiana]|nr:hypothetical protein [Candidatus Hatepunaea meridiana]
MYIHTRCQVTAPDSNAHSYAVNRGGMTAGDSIKNTITYVLLLVIIVGVYFFTDKNAVEETKPDLEMPSPALGKVVATAIHQAVTDPYFAPLEKLAQFLSADPQHDMVTIDQMSSWAPDDEFPICFVWDTDGNKIEVNNAASAWAMDEVVSRVRQAMFRDNPRGLLFINTFIVENEKYWLGFVKVPKQSSDPNQMVGVFFSMDRYLSEDAPRLIDNVVSRRRFPLVQFQLNDKPIHNEKDGDICFRILDNKGEEYFQSGRTFDPEKMIYSESTYYPNPIVCLQQGWDLQVFSSNAVQGSESDADDKGRNVIFIIAIVLISIVYWGGIRKG